MLEFNDPADRGDEFGALVLFVVAIIVPIWQYLAARRLTAQAPETTQAAESVQGKQQ